MRNRNLFADRRARRGDVLIVLLIIFVLAAAVYILRKYIDTHQPDPDIVNGLAPWTELELRAKSKKPTPQISREQAKISGLLKFDMNAYLKGTQESRGELSLKVTPEGQIYGTWSGTYSNDKKDSFDIQSGEYSGQCYPQKIYFDEKGKDPTKLYFIGKGKFMIHKVTADTKKYTIVGGDIYVRGWLNTDLSVTGEIIITSDEKYAQYFEFKSLGPEKQN